MTVASTADWNPALLFIIKQMLFNLGAIAEGEEPSAAMYETGVFQLNALVKGLEATGLHVWAEEEAILFLEPFQKRYVIGGPGINAHTSDSEDWLRLTLTAPAVLGATHVQLSTADGALLSDGMNLGVVDNNNVTEWFTVVGAPVAGLVALSGALLVGVDVGNYALAYTTPIERPLKVPKARLLTLSSMTVTPMTVLSRQEYEDLPDKGASSSNGGGAVGTPTQFFYSPRRDQGLLYIWPVPNLSNWAVRFTWYRPLADFLVPTNTADFPQEWINPLIWNCSLENAAGYGVPPATYERIEKQAEKWAIMAVSYDRESEDVQFGMSYPTGSPD